MAWNVVTDCVHSQCCFVYTHLCVFSFSNQILKKRQRMAFPWIETWELSVCTERSFVRRKYLLTRWHGGGSTVAVVLHVIISINLRWVVWICEPPPDTFLPPFHNDFWLKYFQNNKIFVAKIEVKASSIKTFGLYQTFQLSFWDGGTERWALQKRAKRFHACIEESLDMPFFSFYYTNHTVATHVWTLKNRSEIWTSPSQVLQLVW